MNCVETAEQDVERLSLRPGQSVQINVPSAIGDTPWAVYFRYRDADGELQDGRSEIFTDGQLAYTLRTVRPSRTSWSTSRCRAASS